MYDNVHNAEKGGRETQPEIARQSLFLLSLRNTVPVP